jgi:hypothetical protein
MMACICLDSSLTGGQPSNTTSPSLSLFLSLSLSLSPTALSQASGWHHQAAEKAQQEANAEKAFSALAFSFH